MLAVLWAKRFLIKKQKSARLEGFQIRAIENEVSKDPPFSAACAWMGLRCSDV